MFIKTVFLSLLLTLCLYGSNHLANATSAYLLQHKDNPVDWYPWGQEALSKAQKEKKLIFLSIGYSTCHWCHVMAKESFEDTQVAQLLNKSYVSIKVDREQYPHIDSYYQKVYRSLYHKGGGWPLNVIMTSDKKVLYIATYIPKYGGYGAKYGLVELLKKMAQLSNTQQQSLAASLNDIHNTQHHNTPQKPKDTLIEKAFVELQSLYDTKYYGFYFAPKFPHATTLDFLLELARVQKNTQALKMATHSLEAMAKGGIYDQVGGGFFRYSVDRRWQIPHFEKMLYTNAELIHSYTQGYKATHNPLFKKVVQHTISEIDRFFKRGGVYMSASDADSENFDAEEEEGFYYTYVYDEVVDFLKKHHFTPQEIEHNLHYLGIEEDGNVDGEASLAHITQLRVPLKNKEILQALAEYREIKKPPFIDSKINLAWNALYVDAKLQASFVDERYAQEALDSLESLIKLFYKNGKLYHQTIANKLPKQEALLEDYAFFSKLLFDAYQQTLNPRYWQLFEQMTQQSIKLFYKKKQWWMSADGFEQGADLEDGAYKNPLAQTLINIELLATLHANKELFEIVNTTLQNYGAKINHHSASYVTLMQLFLMRKYEIVYIKSTQKNLRNITLPTTHYPYIYKKVEPHAMFVACKVGSCFAYAKSFQELINKL
jgi:uncharacterized protein YyaL (SSP411 family)